MRPFYQGMGFMEPELNSKGQPADRPGSVEDLHNKINALSTVLDELQEELGKALMKHASMCSPHDGHGVIREELEELWDHVKADTGRTPEARKEALQVAAMAIRYVVDLIDTEKNDGR